MSNSRPLSGSSASPPRPPESPTEVLYNTAVQSFVRRDHLKTHASLSRLLSNLKTQSRKHPRKRWHDLSPPSPASEAFQASGSPGDSAGEGDVEEWLIKTFKLYISSHASLYTDPPSQSPPNRSGGGSQSLPEDMANLVPPHPPSRILEHVVNTALQAYPDGILPPPLVSTLILAALKLHPAEDALGYVHRVTEEWLSNLPDGFMEGIARRSPATAEKRVEAGREGYLKVLELFTGEVLAREGEWEMARGILDGDTLLGSKRKEALYRHLRSIQTRRETPQTASSSGILPSPSASLILPSQSNDNSTTATPKARSRSNSANSASSSEATARPPFALSTATNRFPALNKGKQKAESTESESTLPSRIVVNPPSASNPRRNGSNASNGRGKSVKDQVTGILHLGLGLFPPAVRDRLVNLNVLQLVTVGLPLPLVGLLILFATLRRRATRRGTLSRAAPSPLADVRARLLAARRQGLWAWFVMAIKWWIGKVAGVWKLGTTITYV